jgi:hypothetical protein
VAEVRARDFLAAAYGGLTGYLNVRTLPPVQDAFFPVRDIDALESFVRPRRDRNAYIGVALRLSDHDGSLKGCGSLPAFFADLDFKSSTEHETRDRLASCPLAPSVVVASGGGLQPWWFLKEPIDLQREAPKAKDLLRRLAHSLDADLAAAEPARILRLPNTSNFKYTPARPVRVECFEPDRRYNVCDFDDWLPEEPTDTRVLHGPASEVIPQGQRETALMAFAGSMRRKGLEPDAILAALSVVNQKRCRPPLDERDLRRIATSVGRYAPSDAIEPAVFVNPLPDLLARAATIPEPRYLVEGLIPGDGSVLLHSQPREYKTLMVQALLLALATGTPAFGLERLRVAVPVPVWYITEEDGWWRVTNRFAELLRGYGLDAQTPDFLHVSAGRGLNLDTTEWQEKITATTREQGYRLVVWDPLRSLTETADQGPRELKPFALFMRRFIRETGAVVLIVHHDTKPPSQGTDNRRRPQRASGGGIFSIADSPIHIDRVDDHRRMLVPTDYKFSSDPPAVTLRLEQGPGWLRLMGEETTAISADDAKLDRKILDYLEHSPYSYGSAIAKGAKLRKDDVLRRLPALADLGLVEGTAEAKGTKWFRIKAS